MLDTSIACLYQMLTANKEFGQSSFNHRQAVLEMASVVPRLREESRQREESN
jgi:hypothetical protein